MEIDLPANNIPSNDIVELKKLLDRQKSGLNDLEQMWYLMDLVWDDFGCDNKNLDWDRIGKFYSHPVWLLNGLFQEQDHVSMFHRHAISDWVIEKNIKTVVDYGGGFGTLARLIAQKDPGINVFIYEPHPGEYGLKRANEYENIQIISELESGYDCLVCTDVLEHVPDPLRTFSEMIDSVKVGGSLIIANHFAPSIKCHLPQTFHLRGTFDIFAKVLGLKVLGKLEGTHATIYRKTAKQNKNWTKIRLLEKISRITHPVLVSGRKLLRPIKRLLVR